MLPLRSSIMTSVIGCVSLGKLRDRLQFAVVVDLEVVAREIGNQPAAIVGHRRVDGHRPRTATKLRFLGKAVEW